MTYSEFIQKYANTPLKDRFIMLDGINNFPLSLNMIYKLLTDYESFIRPIKIEEDKLIKLAEERYFNLKQIIG